LIKTGLSDDKNWYFYFTLNSLITGTHNGGDYPSEAYFAFKAA
jgi:hypothetical protein